TDRPQGVGVFLALDTCNGATERDRFLDLLPAINDVGVSAACAPLPLAAVVAVAHAEAWDVAFRIADLLEARVVVHCDEIVGVAAVSAAAFLAVTAAAFLRSRPSAMVAVPRRAVGIDLDAEHLERLVCLRALGRASRTRPAVLAGLVIREPDAVALEQLLRGQRQSGLPHKRS